MDLTCVEGRDKEIDRTLGQNRCRCFRSSDQCLAIGFEVEGSELQMNTRSLEKFRSSEDRDWGL